MERIELEVFSQTTNQAIVRMPGRRFPGVVVQGDTLSGLAADAKLVVAELRAGNRPLDDALELADRLDELLMHHGETLTAHGMALPYSTPEG